MTALLALLLAWPRPAVPVPPSCEPVPVIVCEWDEDVGFMVYRIEYVLVCPGDTP